MPSYKIHSLKDSNKLSFIIDWESEESVQKKLSSEWHIVLSVEKAEIETEKIFVFEWRKPDKTFAEGKIEADDIFVAYEILSKEYNYTITKLYPNSVEDEKERQNIFRKLLSTFEEKKLITPKIISDTSNLVLQKNKMLIEKVRAAVQIIPNNETLLSDLKKLENTNNSTIIHQNLKTIVSDLVRMNRKKKEVFEVLKPLAKELSVFVLPNSCLVLLDNIQKVFAFFHPLISSEEYHKPIRKSAIKKEEIYSNIEKNKHIHTLLKKKYQHATLFQLTDETSRQGYFYVLYRIRSFFFLSRKTALFLWKLLRQTILIFLFGLIVFALSHRYQDLFVFDSSLSFFLLIVILSLVIPSETV